MSFENHVTLPLVEPFVIPSEFGRRTRTRVHAVLVVVNSDEGGNVSTYLTGHLLSPDGEEKPKLETVLYSAGGRGYGIEPLVGIGLPDHGHATIARAQRIASAMTRAYHDATEKETASSTADRLRSRKDQAMNDEHYPHRLCDIGVAMAYPFEALRDAVMDDARGLSTPARVRDAHTRLLSPSAPMDTTESIEVALLDETFSGRLIATWEAEHMVGHCFYRITMASLAQGLETNITDDPLKSWSVFLDKVAAEGMSTSGD